MSTGNAWRKKQEWFDKLQSSQHTPATKLFAWSIFKRMYADKITSYPGTDAIREDTGFTSCGHFTGYRQALIRSGAITANLGYHTKSAQQKNYEYTLNLDWDGSVPPVATALAPQGNAVPPVGTSRSTSGGGDSTRGASNTPNNTSTKTLNKTSTNITGTAVPADVKRPIQDNCSLPKTKKTSVVPSPLTSSKDDGAEGEVITAIDRQSTGGGVVAVIEARVTELLGNPTWGTLWSNPIVRKFEAQRQAEKELSGTAHSS